MSTTPGIDVSTTAPELRLNDPDPALRPAPRDGVVIGLPPMDAGTLDTALAGVAAAFPGEEVQVASPHVALVEAIPQGLRLVSYTGERAEAGWVLTAADYAAAAGLTGDDRTRVVVLLGDQGAATRPDLLRRLVDGARARNADLVLPRFTLGPGEGLVNSALIYPLTRALFGADIQFPLPMEVALSKRMAQRLASMGHAQVGLGQGSSLLWPVSEAAAAGFSVRQVDVPAGPPPVSRQDDFNALFNSVAASLFSDIEAKASVWQRARSLPPKAAQTALPAFSSAEAEADIRPMIESFRLAQANLQELWSLVLPPQSRLALKKLSHESAAEFVLEPHLWARVTYDFVLAFHLRTLNRGHLLGALIPLYLAWVASHLRAAANDASRAARHIDDTAAAFEAEKPYLVARWRWPDRFNP